MLDGPIHKRFYNMSEKDKSMHPVTMIFAGLASLAGIAVGIFIWLKVGTWVLATFFGVEF